MRKQQWRKQRSERKERREQTINCEGNLALKDILLDEEFSLLGESQVLLLILVIILLVLLE